MTLSNGFYKNISLYMKLPVTLLSKKIFLKFVHNSGAVPDSLKFGA